MRLFIAINFSDQIKGKILALTKALKSQFPRISWVRSENLHLTLKFLGYTKEDKLEGIKRGIEAVVKDFEPFELNISRTGYFQREPFIIQLNIENSVRLNSLAERLDKEMGRLGFKKEIRPYSPHITLGRGRKLKKEEIEEIKRATGETATFPSIGFTVKEIALVESQLKPSGAIYTVLSEFGLN